MKQAFSHHSTRITVILLGIILLIALFLRLFQADVLPISMNNDEIDFIVQSKSVFYTFTDLDRTWNPLSLKPLAQDAKSEILYLVLAPVFGPLAITLLNIRIPYIVINLGVIILLYLFVRYFFKREVALCAALVAAINPWMLFLSRTAFESHVALFFFLGGIVTLLYAKANRILLAVPLFALGFYSYMGTKVIFVPVIVLTCFLMWHLNKKQCTKQYLTTVVLTGLVFVFFLTTLLGGGSSDRVNDFSLNSESISKTVNGERQQSIPHPLRNLFSNKLTIGARDATERYFGAFSFDMLYTQGDPHSLYGFWDHGLFYYTDIILLLAGILYTYQKKRQLSYYLIALALIGAVPSALSHVDTSYVHRSSFTLFALLVFTGIGLYALYDFLIAKKMGKLVIVGFCLIQVIQVINFYHIYLYRNQIYNPIQGAYENRVIARYADLTMDTGRRIVIVADNKQALMKSYLFYSDEINAGSIRGIQAGFGKANPTIKNITYDNTCPKVMDKDTTYVVFAEKCIGNYPGVNYQAIPILKDGNPIYRIYNDRICTKTKLINYTESFDLATFNIEKLPTEKFCRAFIVQPIFTVQLIQE